MDGFTHMMCVCVCVCVCVWLSVCVILHIRRPLEFAFKIEPEIHFPHIRWPPPRNFSHCVQPSGSAGGKIYPSLQSPPIKFNCMLIQIKHHISIVNSVFNKETSFHSIKCAVVGFDDTDYKRCKNHTWQARMALKNKSPPSPLQGNLICRGYLWWYRTVVPTHQGEIWD